VDTTTGADISITISASGTTPAVAATGNSNVKDIYSCFEYRLSFTGSIFSSNNTFLPQAAAHYILALLPLSNLFYKLIIIQ
jgi:hypothetical protein